MDEGRRTLSMTGKLKGMISGGVFLDPRIRLPNGSSVRVYLHSPCVPQAPEPVLRSPFVSDSPHILRSGSLTLDCSLPVSGGAHIMGVLNITPDSFSDGGLYLDPNRAMERAATMAAEGAIILDIGGASSRPKGATYGQGASLISAEEECHRILPVIERIAKDLPGVWISVDTFRSDVAEAALKAGAHMINDITALRFDPQLADVVARHRVPLALMHSVGLPGDMPHVAPSTDIVEEVASALREAAKLAAKAGCDQMILDPGFGFGKTMTDNLALMSGVEDLLALGHPVLVGVSRKSSIAQAAAGPGASKDELPPPSDRLPGSLAATGVAVQHGASIVRTHDVAATRQYLNVLEATIRAGKGQI